MACSRHYLLASINFCEDFHDDDLRQLLNNGSQLTWLRLRKGHNWSAVALTTNLSGLVGLTRLDLSECVLLDDGGKAVHALCTLRTWTNDVSASRHGYCAILHAADGTASQLVLAGG